VFDAPAAGEPNPAGDATNLPARGAIIGAVTSSTIAPMLSQTAIAFAMMKWGKHRPGTKVTVPAEGSLVSATVQGLKFL
jgi:glycine cleavage system aminomethyltransferase T